MNQTPATDALSSLFTRSVGPDGHLMVVLTDLGTSRIFNQSPSSGVTALSRAYDSGDVFITHQADVWALGASYEFQVCVDQQVEHMVSITS